MNKELDPMMFNLFEFRPRKGDLKRMEIIQATIDCLSTMGIDNTTYDAIAKKVGTSRAHIAYYFSDKEQIYLAAIKYILAAYQQTVIDNLSEAKSGRDMLERYIESVFIWAQKYPDQLSVMLLLYYLCSYRDEMIELNHQIRKGGYERLYYILTTKLNKRYSEKKATTLARAILSLITGSIIDSVATKGTTLEDARERTIQTVRMLID